jgi:mRNA interferase MazF
VVARGDVWLARLDPTEGRELRKTRPCIVISPPEIHDYLDLVIIAPLTTGSRPARYRVPVSFSGKLGLILLEQVRAVDRRRLVRHMGTVNRKTLSTVLRTMQELFGESEDLVGG